VNLTKLVLGICVTFAMVMPRAGAAPELANSIVAVVGDVVITYKEVWDSIASSIDVLKARYLRSPDVLQQKIEALAREDIQQLVANQLILNDFTNAGYNLPETFIDDRVQARIRQDYYGDRATLMKTLREKGITLDGYKKGIRDNIIIEFLVDKHISKQLIVSPHKIEAYYEANIDKYKLDDQVKLRMIVLNKPKDFANTARNMAQEILSKLEKGVPFAEMAAIYSEGSSRTDGGNWGWAERSFLQKDLATVAFSLKAGERSGVIETADACYIMLVEDARPAHTKPLSEVRGEIEKALLAKEHDRLLKKWIDRLESKAFVRYFPYQIVLQ
jgi:parvulin-like peptidyl-prolyl isomerase